MPGMSDVRVAIPTPINEPVKLYAPDSPERSELEGALKALSSECPDVTANVGGEAVTSDAKLPLTMPHAHGEQIAHVHESSPETVDRAIESARSAAKSWARTPLHERAAIFLRAAELLAGPWRQRINAACMLGQGKTCYQAEIDAACELIDFIRFNVHFAQRIADEQPISSPGIWNQSEMRPLEGFVFAVTPFNFLAIALNLPTAPAIMGNAVVWKPAHETALGAYHMMALLKEAGLPDGVINVVPGAGPAQGAVALASPHLAGVHFTGSTGTFHALWKGVAENLDNYRTFPRIVGETGGKDFILMHPSADPEQVATAIVRGGYEYQGQKCSAASRVYIPKSRWKEVSERVSADIDAIKMGDVRDFSNFMGAVINEKSFEKISGYLKLAKDSANVLRGGEADRSKGWFVRPTFLEVSDPKHRMMEEEIFGPVVTAYVYDDQKWGETLDLVDGTSKYALTGAVFSNDRAAATQAREHLVQAAGNFYINDKPTGAVVGQQPFGGSRASGTNDKAGSMWNLLRWVSPRSVKETFCPPRDFRYPHMS